MKQSIIFALIVSFLSLVGLKAYSSTFDQQYLYQTIEIKENGELIYSDQLKPYDRKLIWYFEDENQEDLILQDYEIIDYFGFDTQLDFLYNPATLDWDLINDKLGDNGEINMLMVDKGTVDMYEANCPDKKCVKQGSISKPGQSIICAPHKLVVSIAGQKGDGTDA